MNKYQKRVIKSKVCGIENAYILISGYEKERDDGFNFKTYDYHVSFLYDGGNVATEWEPRHGPIQVWYKAAEENDDKREHYFYDYVLDRNLDWSQLAVEREGLHFALLYGDTSHIFSVLKRWCESNATPYERED